MSRVCRPGARRAAAPRRAGFTLLEVLVAAVILAVGLLALGAAEITAAGATGRSRAVSIATAYGEEMIERIRRNRDEVAAYDGFDTQDPTTRPTGAGILQTDYDQWKSRLEQGGQAGLGGARGTVTVLTDSPIPGANAVRVAVSWSDGTDREVVVMSVLFN
ncbi:MAG TPA: prepilin-type N-terminal cleavage/methylation domain-containing protein [Thermodesulfobacteriota bacterium]